MKRVILIEDDPAILETMTIILRSAGHSVTTYPNGDLVLNNDFTIPDIFIIDRQLPGADGLDLCKHLKTQPDTKDIPIIIVSASSNIHALSKNAMADEAIEKPFKMKELRDIVNKHLKK